MKKILCLCLIVFLLTGCFHSGYVHISGVGEISIITQKAKNEVEPFATIYDDLLPQDISEKSIFRYKKQKQQIIDILKEVSLLEKMETSDFITSQQMTIQAGSQDIKINNQGQLMIDDQQYVTNEDQVRAAYQQLQSLIVIDEYKVQCILMPISKDKYMLATIYTNKDVDRYYLNGNIDLEGLDQTTENTNSERSFEYQHKIENSFEMGRTGITGSYEMFESKTDPMELLKSKEVIIDFYQNSNHIVETQEIVKKVIQVKDCIAIYKERDYKTKLE